MATQQSGQQTRERKFSTVLPSVASLRSKFEKPGAPPPPALRSTSSSTNVLKSTPSQTSLLKTSSSVQAGLKATASPVKDASVASSSPTVVAENGSHQVAAESDAHALANRLSMVAEAADETRSEISTEPPSRRTSTMPSIDRRPSIPVSRALQEDQPVSQGFDRRPSLPVSRVQTDQGLKVDGAPSSPATSSSNVPPERRPSVVPSPPTASPPKPPEIPASRSPGPVTPTSRSVAPVIPPSRISSEGSEEPVRKAEGILYCCDGYSWTLDALRILASELEARLKKRSFLDPTLCQSSGMRQFLENCEAVVAFVESGTISATVRFQIARALEYQKKLALFYVEDNITLKHNSELMDHLCSLLAVENENGRSSADWKALLDPKLVPFVLSPLAEDRRVRSLQPLEAMLTGGAGVVFSQVLKIPEAPPSSNVFLITGFHPDRLDRLAIEFLARGQTAYVSESLGGVKCTACIFCLPSEHDEVSPLFAEKQMSMTSNIAECRSRGLAMVAVRAEHPGKWIPHELSHLVFAADASPEDLSRACDVPTHILKTQGDALEPFRQVAEKARRFSRHSNRDALLVDVLANAKNDKINLISAPSGWGKTTLLAELCRKHNPVVSVLSKSVPDATETIGALYFFNRMDPSRSNSSTHCIKAICRQLSASIPGFVVEGETLQETLEDASASATALLDVLVVQPAVQLTQKGRPPLKKVFVVVDALDECEDVEAFQAALNTKWQSVPPWLSLVCSCQTRPQIVAKHWEFTFESLSSSVKSFMENRLKNVWKVPGADQILTSLLEKSNNNFLWLQICEPILVNLCEEAAAVTDGDGQEDEAALCKAIDTALAPAGGEVSKAVKYIFDRYVEQDGNQERVRQSYSLAVCAPRSFLPVEIYSHCGVPQIPPLLVIEDLCVKPIHAKVLDALLSEEQCGIKLDQVKDHSLVSESLEKAYAASSQTTKTAKRFAAAHGAYHARLANKAAIAKVWFEDFRRLYDAVCECVRETGDALRLAQDAEDCQVAEDVVDVIRLASTAVAFDTREFPGQVMGRLPPSHVLSQRAKQFAVDVLVKQQNIMVALPNPFFSGLAPARGPLRKVLKHRGPVLAAAESNGFAVACSGQAAYIWNLAGTDKVGMLKGHADEIRCCSFGCGPQAGNAAAFTFMCLTGSADSTAKLWQGTIKPSPSGSSPTQVFACTKTFTGHDSGVTCLAYRGLDGGNVVFATGSADKTVIIWDFATAAVKVRLRGHAGDVRSLAVVDAQTMLTGSQDKTCRVWDYVQGKEVGRLDGHTRDVSAIAVKRDASVAFTASFDGVARSFDLKTRKVLREYKGHSQRINSVAISADGKRLATSSYDNSVRVFDADTAELLIVLKGHGNDVNCVRFCSDDFKCITASFDCEVRLWSVAKERVERFQSEARYRHDDPVTCVGLTNRFACTGSSDGSARMWNLETGAFICELKGHEETLTSVAVASDGTRAVTGSEDGEVKIWDVSTGGSPKEARTLKGHEDSIESVCLSEDGLYVHTASYDKQMFVWDARTGEMAGNDANVRFPSVPASRKQESRHILGPNGASVGFTLDAPGFAVALFADDDRLRPRTFGELNDLFYLWEWYTAELL